MTVTADVINTVYGQTPVFTASYAGFVLSETPAALGGRLIFTSSATATSTVSSSPYLITPSGLASTNYAITYVPGVDIVSPAAVLVPPTTSPGHLRRRQPDRHRQAHRAAALLRLSRRRPGRALGRGQQRQSGRHAGQRHRQQRRCQRQLPAGCLLHARPLHYVHSVSMNSDRPKRTAADRSHPIAVDPKAE